MADTDAIEHILITRDVTAFVTRDWTMAEMDFDTAQFTGFSAATGSVRLDFPTLDSYRDSWLAQANRLTALTSLEQLTIQLADAQRLDSIEIRGAKALAVKVFDGAIDLSDGTMETLEWTTLYFLRNDPSVQRWLVTGFVGFLKKGWTP